ncbi:glycerol-3-phosphate dehydrogenase [Alteromonas aestuariivivens]|uniref:Glycerol-3-phosphate dehydrogenase n=1 Tax=Alteromonas aestuariivivens TaxID=1938339 RepID=A0A3D8MEU0_9ALTE|nr:glycerol-3-phosphate dehydrogenase [Alteromonas aestuariivivens]RDV29024.1 glycerol-3-phosphate dehydrogenase [Alteromonas aestuariivivens]
MSERSGKEYDVDLLVIGGGVNGTGIAADAAGRGLSVLLCEKGDLGSATSSSSSKLIHGGLRYLEHYEFKLVREALAEREVLLAKAPHIIWPLRFRLPHQKHLRPEWMIRAGLFLYDSLAKRNVLPRSRKVKTHAQGPLVADIKTCFEYSDCWVDDARLVILNALAARDQGADIRPQTECVGVQPNGKCWQVTLKSKDGSSQTVKARALVNAAGPWAASFLERVSGNVQKQSMRMVKGSHIIVPRLYDSEEAYILQNKDGRIVFTIPFEGDFTLVGTTDEDYTGDPSNASISEAEKGYLIEIVNQYFRHKISADDIVHTYSGVRPLLEDESASAQTLTRDYRIELNNESGHPPLLNIFGGKITTFRTLSQSAVDKLKVIFPRMKASWTRRPALPGGSFSSHGQLESDLRVQYPWLPEELCARYVRQYGLLCHKFLAGKSQLSAMGQDFGAGLMQAEVDYLIEEEWASCAEDILWRRTKQGLRLSGEQVKVLETYLSERRCSRAELSARPAVGAA